MDRHVGIEHMKMCAKCVNIIRAIDPQTLAHKPPESPKDLSPTPESDFEANRELWQEAKQ